MAKRKADEVDDKDGTPDSSGAPEKPFIIDLTRSPGRMHWTEALIAEKANAKRLSTNKWAEGKSERVNSLETQWELLRFSTT